MSRVYKAGDLARSVLGETNVRSEYFGEFRGIKTGVSDLDAKVDDMFDSGSLIVLAGPSGGGKTAAASQVAVSAAAQVPTLWLSLEDEPRDVMRRCLSNVARADVSGMRRGFEEGTPEAVEAAAQYFDGLPLEISQKHGSAVELCRDIIMWAEDQADLGLPIRGFVVVDQLSHIMYPKPGDREFWQSNSHLGVSVPSNPSDTAILEYNTSALRQVANYYGLSMLLLHQTNENRSAATGGVDQSSVRGSRGINHKADGVIIIEALFEEDPFPGSPTRGKVEQVRSDCSKFVCVKARRGRGDWSVRLWFDGKHQRWANPSEKASGTGEYTAPAGFSSRSRDAAAALAAFSASDNLTAISRGPVEQTPTKAIPASSSVDDGWDPNELEARR